MLTLLLEGTPPLLSMAPASVQRLCCSLAAPQDAVRDFVQAGLVHYEYDDAGA